MNIKKLVQAGLAAFFVLFVIDFFIHSVGLADLYRQTAKLWRSDAEIKNLIWLMWVSYFVMSFVLVYIYSKGYEDGKPGLAQGLRFGFWIGILQSVPMALCCYAVMPVPAALAVGWFIGGMVEMVAVGAAVGLIWKRGK